MPKKKVLMAVLALIFAVMQILPAFANELEDKQAEYDDVQQKMQQMEIAKERARREAEAQFLLCLLSCCCQNHNQIEIREHNAELTVRTICAEGARITAHPALIAVDLRPVFYVAFRIALRLNLFAAGAFKPFFSKQLFSFPLALSGQKIREFCHILRHHLHTASTELRSVSEQRTGKGCDAKRLQQTGFQKLCDVLSRFFPQNGSQHVSSGCIVFIKRSRLMEHWMMKKGRNPVFGIVHNLRLVTTTHNQQVMQRDFFEIFGWIFRQQGASSAIL